MSLIRARDSPRSRTTCNPDSSRSANRRPAAGRQWQSRIPSHLCRRTVRRLVHFTQSEGTRAWSLSASHLCGLDGGLRGVNAKVRRGQVLQLAAERAEWRALRLQHDDGH